MAVNGRKLPFATLAIKSFFNRKVCKESARDAKENAQFLSVYGRGITSPFPQTVHLGETQSLVRLRLLLRMAFVKLLLTFAKTEQYLCLALLKIDFQRHEGLPLFLGTHGKPLDFPAVQQQFPFPLRFVIETVRFDIFGNVAVDEPDFAVSDFRVGFGECDRAPA